MQATALPILGFPSIYAYILWHRTTKFDVVTQIGRGPDFLGGQPRSQLHSIHSSWSATCWTPVNWTGVY